MARIELQRYRSLMAAVVVGLLFMGLVALVIILLGGSGDDPVPDHEPQGFRNSLHVEGRSS